MAVVMGRGAAEVWRFGDGTDDVPDLGHGRRFIDGVGESIPCVGTAIGRGHRVPARGGTADLEEPSESA